MDKSQFRTVYKARFGAGWIGATDAKNSIGFPRCLLELEKVAPIQGTTKKFETMRGCWMILMPLSTRDWRAEIATGIFSWWSSLKSSITNSLGTKVPSNLYPNNSHIYLFLFLLIIPVEELFAEVDRFWLDYLNRNVNLLSDKCFADFYCHPVWCLNLVFSSVDPVSVHYREAMIKAFRLLSIEAVANLGWGWRFSLDFERTTSELKSGSLRTLHRPKDRSRFIKKNIEFVRQTPSQVCAYVFIDVLKHPLKPLNYFNSSGFVNETKDYFKNL